MTNLRLIHAIAAALCGAAIVAVVLGGIRIALAAIILVLFLQLWSLEVLRTAPTRRETR
ncbi:MAG TPA: hypothetical protein VF638_05465 [Sphingomonas sp.]|jgi:Flp pilus assembly protein TadB